jgi:hypothetical protein
MPNLFDITFDSADFFVRHIATDGFSVISKRHESVFLHGFIR